jgi:sarcosine oxidase subunit alpha
MPITSDTVRIRINNSSVKVPAGTVVAAALAYVGVTQFRRSITGQPRGPLCGMGICMECRVTINGQPNCRSCQIICADNMEIISDG